MKGFGAIVASLSEPGGKIPIAPGFLAGINVMLPKAVASKDFTQQAAGGESKGELKIATTQAPVFLTFRSAQISQQSARLDLNFAISSSAPSNW
eukprot:CAMPEP_0197677142 /NCGR_PEP_ID=MMETSP1338-20131121/87925_1 /TAXON_ID=43686 ORGANISM="Pelagodinium beii, Strain RCC1491" /NCGR_SAMPLE_ID=MMETSP1338 /ASSEMBLY_ACC=CAM_ASM_000754 /LENGTH=93 /DNA_ID=CAMNT_0043257933 /DNA_START=149 /DNA_END=430 /DNA_ORIENTATION=+